MTSDLPVPAVALVGGGPRAVSVLERLASALIGTDAAGRIHVIDDVQPGAGRVWRPDQPRELCMNTLADAVSLFTDASVTMAGRVHRGPTLHEWSLIVSRRDREPGVDLDPAFVRMLEETPPRAGLAEDYASELAAQRPESHPSRSLFGEYVSWCYARARAAMPPGIVVTEHRGRAVAIDEIEGRQHIGLSDGTAVVADAVALLPGWLPREPSAQEHVFARAVRADPSLVWIRPDSPADQPLDSVPDSSDVIVRGLGMGFFDAMALLTIERGGRFDESNGRWEYHPSGREPVLHITSPRGLPYRAKSLYGGLPPKAAQRHLRAADWLDGDRPVDFEAEAWPLIVKDALEDYCRTLDPWRLAVPVEEATARITACSADAESVLALADALIADEAARDVFRGIFTPAPDAADPDAFDAWVQAFIADDLGEAERGSQSALKAALWSVSGARTVCARAGAFGRFTPGSLSGYRRLHAIGGMAGSGPPAFRSRQLLALARAGVARFLGGGVQVAVGEGGFAARDAHDRVICSAPVLVDAFMHFHDAEASADPLFRHLVDAGRARPFRIGPGRDVPTGGVDVEPGTWRLIDAQGHPDPRLLLGGIPLEQTLGDTIISPMPGADATMLRECDAIGRQLAAVLGRELDSRESRS